MDLQEFVRESLLQVSRGITEANDAMLVDKPDNNKRRYFFLNPGSESKFGQGIHFDVAVTVNAGGDAKAGAKLKLVVVEAEFGAGGDISRERVSRVQFTVSVDQYVG